MLKQLRIQNIILVENADISFSSGLNILTGETGSGKSAIMHGLSLAIGERVDTSLIRKGCDKGVVEAIFDIDRLNLNNLLEEGGIDHESHQDLIIRREIAMTGKNRIFINNQSAQASFLRRLGSQIVQIVGQRANQNLFNLDYHREVLDIYGGLSPFLQRYKESYIYENELKKRLDLLIQQDAHRMREIDICKSEWEELEEAQLKSGEDEELFTEYTILFNSEELSEKTREINQALSGEKISILATLNRQKQNLESLSHFDPILKEVEQSFQSVFLELQEISHTLRHYQNKLNHNPERLQIVNERLSLLNRLKRKYGGTIDEVIHYQQEIKQKLFRLENTDIEIEELKIELQQAQTDTNDLARILSEKRVLLACQLQTALSTQLHSLNMPKAEFKVIIEPQKRTSIGDDKIEFFLQPNVGEHQIALKDGASGGEISRVLLALQTILAGKEKILTLIFDEVDANIGGETASIVGDKLKEIGKQHQVICITHFPQVASLADHHLQISKVEKDGRTLTQVLKLDKISCQQELARMAGQKSLAFSE
ncbi:DNA repair protein RecN [Candidatus Protochlamydia amoebophila]|uniref:DNA repair protein RecN n=1 Tax=Candidatus Protochlamydia amoebophila TaxID=362787 RepID=UPI001BC95E7E|nr:DNA repair protein RecN [Candidatus Protochlamydia amoebophila]MBS4163968.1 DNA repair protein RecN [Candidatus Protochlamydia amoebophila]